MAIPLRLLILEDNPSDAALMLNELSRAGYEPVSDRAETEQEYRTYLKLAPEVILADFSMPGFDALRALEIMHECQPGTPVIIVSGSIDGERAVKIMQHGACDYIVKDRMGRLAQAVTQALAQKSLKADKRRAEQSLFDSEILTKRAQEEHLREQIALKHAEQANRMKDQFLATLSHELRTPLTPMLGWCRMLLEGGTDEETRIKGLKVIERNIKAQCNLIEDILDISRIITGKLLLNLTTVDIHRIVDAAIETSKTAADGKEIKLERTFTHDEAIHIAGDPHRLEQIVSNLLTNAVKFTPNGGKIQVGLQINDGNVEISVKDSGIGIDADFLPHVFERFSQADATCVRKHGGLGIGLSLVKHLTELHGGNVRVSSDGKDQGATFTVSLPMRKTNYVDAQQIQPSETPLVKRELLHNVKILVVDDEQDTRELLQYTFQRYEAKVTTAKSVREALACYLREKPDLILSDIGMPIEDGFTLIKELRALEIKSGTFTPAFALSAFAREEDYNQALSAGFQKHIAKPIDPIVLAVEVSKYLKKT